MPPKNKAPANLAEARERRWPQQQEQPEEDAEPVAAAGAAPPPPPAEAGLPPHPAMARKRLRDRPQQQHDGEQRQWGGMAGAVLGAVATALTSPFKAAAAAAAAVLSPSRPPRPVRRRLADDGTRSEQQPAVGSDGELRAGMEVESGQLSGSSTEAEDEGPRRVLVGSPPAPPVQQQAAAREEPPPAPQQQQAQQRRQQEQQEQQGRQGQQEQEHAQEHAQEQPPGGGWVLRSRGVAATRQEGGCRWRWSLSPPQRKPGCAVTACLQALSRAALRVADGPAAHPLSSPCRPGPAATHAAAIHRGLGQG